ncbi:hypothetical protein ABTM77_20700, partial [Acinetobacter baumannii]
EGGWNAEIAAPEWESLTEDDDPEDFARIVPVYPLTEGLQQKVVRKAAKSAVLGFLNLVRDPLPASMIRQHGLLDLKSALRQIHIPE